MGWRKTWQHLRTYRKIYNRRLAKNFGRRFYWQSITNRVLARLTRRAKYWQRLEQLNLTMLADLAREVTFPEPGAITPIPPDFAVFVFWGQGLEHAPAVVRACVASIRRHFAGHPVHVLTQENYHQFVTVPPELAEKLARGVISWTHFSDWLRFALLAQYGGLWLDATVWVRAPFADRLGGGCSFYTQKFAPTRAQGRCWSSFFVACGPGNPVAVAVREMLTRYWQKYNTLSDYFLLDLVLTYVYEHLPAARAQIDAVPVNNVGLFKLYDHYRDPYDPTAPWFTTTDLFKLTYKTDQKPRPGSWHAWILRQAPDA